MTLIFTPPSLTRFYNSGGYAKNELVDLSSTPFQDVPVGLLTWLQTQISEGESVAQIVLEDGGKVESVAQIVLEDGRKVETESGLAHQVINAGISINSPDNKGQRSISISSEYLPLELRDGLIAAWEYVSALD